MEASSTTEAYGETTMESLGNIVTEGLRTITENVTAVIDVNSVVENVTEMMKFGTTNGPVDDEDYNGSASGAYEGEFVLYRLTNDSSLQKSYIHDVVEDDTNPWLKYTKILHTYVLLLVIVLGCLGNIASFLTFVVGPLRKKAFGVFLTFLAVSDTMVLGTAVVSCTSLLVPDLVLHKPWCTIVQYLAYFSSFFSIWIIVVFTCERCVAVCKSWPPRRPLRACHALGLMVGLAIATGGLYSWVPLSKGINTEGTTNRMVVHVCDTLPEYAYMAQIAELVDIAMTAVIPSLVIVIMNICMICSLRKSHLHIVLAGGRFKGKKQPPRPQTPASFNDANKIWSIGKSESMQVDETLRSTTRLLIIISTTFVLLNLPYGITRSHGAILHLLYPEDTTESFPWYIASETAKFLFYVNFAVNFFLYCLCSKDFRDSLSDCCCCKCCPKRRYALDADYYTSANTYTTYGGNVSPFQ